MPSSGLSLVHMVWVMIMLGAPVVVGFGFAPLCPRRTARRQLRMDVVVGVPTRLSSLPQLKDPSMYPLLLEGGYGLSELSDVANGLESWSLALLKGLVPVRDSHTHTWPGDPLLFDSIVETFFKLNLPKLTQKHPVLISAVMKSLVEMVLEWEKKVEEELSQSEEGEGEDQSSGTSTAPSSRLDQLQTFKEDLSSSIMRKFESKWAPPLGGIEALDEMYGADHDLIDVEDSGSQDGVSGGMGSGAGGFGLFDGIWKSDGWSVVKDLQARIRDMPELRALVSSLGRRPSVSGDVMKKVPPQRFDQNAPLGVTRDSRAIDEQSGMRRSDSLERLLPSETILLSRRSAQRSRLPKLLFLSKIAEKTLLSYEMSGWVEDFARSRRKPWRHLERVPVTTGGPIILCLDTSYSMVGPREQLAKAVALEVASLSAKDHRPLYLLAFSGAANLATCELPLGVNKQSLATLLNFLGKAFKGGTDVTTPLARAVDLLENSPEWASADILLVTDGELMNPPLPPDLMEKILLLEKERGLEVHGVLVGQRLPTPQLDWICTKWDGLSRVHNFLYKYDPLLAQFCAPDEDDQPEDEWQRSSLSPQDLAASRGGVRSVGSQRFCPRPTKRAGSPRSRTMALSMTTDSSSSSSSSSTELRPLIEQVIATLGEALVERDSEVRLLLLATLSREHIVLLGPPGTGKSALARRLGVLSGGLFFERLLTKFSTPEEIFGPYSLMALEQDRYVRNTQGYLPSASVVFLDEIFKASSAILNSLLSVLNERQYDNGNSTMKIPLVTLVAASNELPDSDELDALYDRFLFRRMVAPISDAEIHRLLLEPEPVERRDDVELKPQGPVHTLVSTQLAASIAIEATRVSLPPAVIGALTAIRAHLRDKLNPQVYVSDRRLKKAAAALRVSALCNGRQAVSATDLLLLQHMLWYAPEDQEPINKFIWDVLVPPSSVSSFAFLADAVSRRLESALLQDNEEKFASERVELERLIAVVAEKQREAQQLARDLATANVFLDPDSQQRALVEAVPKANSLANQYGNCSRALQLLQQEVAMTPFKLEQARLNTAETVAAMQTSALWRSGFGLGAGADRDPLGQSMDLIFDTLDLSMSVKEAKRTLTKEQFKEWKRLGGGGGKKGGEIESYWN